MIRIKSSVHHLHRQEFHSTERMRCLKTQMESLVVGDLYCCVQQPVSGEETEKIMYHLPQLTKIRRPSGQLCAHRSSHHLLAQVQELEGEKPTVPPTVKYHGSNRYQ
jgi:hypothetical protein